MTLSPEIVRVIMQIPPGPVRFLLQSRTEEQVGNNAFEIKVFLKSGVSLQGPINPGLCGQGMIYIGEGDERVPTMILASEIVAAQFIPI